MQVWIVFTGEYENYGPFGPAFANELAAQRFAEAEDGEVRSFDVFDGEAEKLTHYECSGWLKDPRESCPLINLHVFEKVRPFGGYWINEEKWSSWDILVPAQVEVKAAAYHGKGPLDYAEAHGRGRELVREAVIDALSKL